MPATAHVRRRAAPIEIIQESLRAAKDMGLYVRLGAYGVACVSTQGRRRWEVDPLCRQHGVSIIGAVLLVQQPPALDIPEAACLALGVDARWMAGFELGLEVDAKATPELTDHVALHGFESAVLFRISILSHRAPSGVR